ncbi:hypothetical protein [Staphylococcus aureus]|uniref:hypothetical protein n=1 Tax=Staphylococcus aureus TaxID=1280 RepID=UPI001C52A8AE
MITANLSNHLNWRMTSDNAGLKLKDMTGLHYNPLTKRYWLAPNVDVNYMVYTAKEQANGAAE